MEVSTCYKKTVCALQFLAKTASRFLFFYLMERKMERYSIKVEYRLCNVHRCRIPSSLSFLHFSFVNFWILFVWNHIVLYKTWMIIKITKTAAHLCFRIEESSKQVWNEIVFQYRFYNEMRWILNSSYQVKTLLGCCLLSHSEGKWQLRKSHYDCVHRLWYQWIAHGMTSCDFNL